MTKNFRDTNGSGKIDAFEDKSTQKIRFFCQKCDKLHEIEVPSIIFNSSYFPVSYVYVHEDSKIIAILYIDKNYQVRGVDYPIRFGIDKNQLTAALEKSKNHSFELIPENKIYVIKISSNGKILKLYYHPDYYELSYYPIIQNMKKMTSTFVNMKESSHEYYMKYSNVWILGLEMIDYDLLMVVDESIDIEHLKVQAMNLLENFRDLIK
ncbi:MAG: hypothetical protein ACTSVU_06290 [Promethearchaeota archaeon]